MHSVYEVGQRSWISDVISLKSYFSEYKSLLPPFENSEKSTSTTDGRVRNRDQERKTKVRNIMDVSLSEDEVNILAETCSLDKLAVEGERRNVDVRSLKARPGLYEKDVIPDSALHLETLRFLKRRIMNTATVANLKYRSSIWPSTEPSESQDLEVGNHILLMVRVYHPFVHRSGVRNSNPPRCSQEMIVLGHQTMDVLRDKIVCPCDLSVAGDLSENPDKKFSERAKDIYKSGFIYIEGTFYNDCRDSINIDYSVIIRKWASDRGMGPFQTAVMETTKFEDLSLRLGYPYVYKHQGSCEHLIVFSDVRLIHQNDSLSSSSYPSLRSMSTTNAQYCMICGVFTARWITLDNERVPHDPCYFCDHCFRSYNYIDGKKIGKFQAYPFYGKP